MKLPINDRFYELCRIPSGIFIGDVNELVDDLALGFIGGAVGVGYLRAVAACIIGVAIGVCIFAVLVMLKCLCALILVHKALQMCYKLDKKTRKNKKTPEQ